MIEEALPAGKGVDEKPLFFGGETTQTELASDEGRPRAAGGGAAFVTRTAEFETLEKFVQGGFVVVGAEETILDHSVLASFQGRRTRTRELAIGGNVGDR